MTIDITEILFTIVPAALTCLACIGLFLKYIKMKNQSVGFSVVIILCISNFVFSTAIILRILPSIPFTEELIFKNVFHTAMFFSIYWASTVCYLVYYSLVDENFACKKIVAKTALAILALALITNLFLFYLADLHDLYKILCPVLAATTIFNIIYYAKSIKILKEQAQYFARSSKIYMRGLRCYFGAQVITSVPLIIYLSFKKIYGIELEEGFTLSKFLEELIAFSGFINAVNFAVQGPGRESNVDLKEDDELYLSFADEPETRSKK